MDADNGTPLPLPDCKTVRMGRFSVSLRSVRVFFTQLE